MSTLIDMINYMIILCNTAAGLRLLYCLIRIKANPDEASSYTKKMSNLMMFLVLANMSLVLLSLGLSYFT
jgi:hypothetical protein